MNKSLAAREIEENIRMSADNLGVKLNKPAFKCSICDKSWLKNDPRFLPCSHVFCSKCLEKFQGCKQLNCPKCSSVFSLPGNGILSLPKFTMFQEISDNYEDIFKSTEVDQMNEVDEDDEEEEYFGMEDRKSLIKDEKYRIMNLLKESKREESELLKNLNDFFENVRKEVERQSEITKYNLMSAFKDKRRLIRNSMKAFDIFTSVSSFKEESDNILKSCQRLRRKALDTEVILKLKEQSEDMTTVHVLTQPSLSKFTMTKFIELDENITKVIDCCVHKEELYCLCSKNDNCILTWFNLDGKFIKELLVVNNQINNLSAISLTIDLSESIVFFVCQSRESIYSYPLYRKDVTLTKFLNVINVRAICSVLKGLLVAEGRDNYSISMYQTNKLRLWTIKEESSINLISRAETEDHFYIVTEANQLTKRNLKYGNRLTSQLLAIDDKCEKMIQYHTGLALTNSKNKSIIAVNQDGKIDENYLKLEYTPTSIALSSKLFTDYLYVFATNGEKNHLLIFLGN
ncbi:DgyrCDS8371 [Dimorphilus gyrociliatus]|uniref:DgyrCDS8371 n=1 Tax=Dimorphilus gyrociliatus TaxID=2664684 RepID=A0A7I8VU16_9ANNE|nr:DgyrCDS8371 [Dimorphilus gyrociliatus]